MRLVQSDPSPGSEGSSVANPDPYLWTVEDHMASRVESGDQQKID